MNNNVLFTTYQLNHQLTLKNKIVMPPMTRAKATDDGLPTQSMAEYYARRADAGLIITEGVVISPEGRGFENVGGIYNSAQVNAWKNVTNAVHANNGLIFMQIWHVGRVSHPVFQNGKLPISASETVMTGRMFRTNGLNYGKSRAASLEEINALIKGYAQAAKNAIEAGFDGIEIHAANGYLIDQFLHYDTNKREDKYGGSPENMARFALEIVKACGAAIGYEKIGIRISPGAYLNEIVGDTRDAAVFSYLLNNLSSLPITYVHTGNFDDTKQFTELNNMTMTDFIRMHYRGTVIASGGYTTTSGQQGMREKRFDLVAIGRPFIANPDLITRMQRQDSLVNYDKVMLDTLF